MTKLTETAKSGLKVQSEARAVHLSDKFWIESDYDTEVEYPIKLILSAHMESQNRKYHFIKQSINILARSPAPWISSENATKMYIVSAFIFL